MNLSNEEIRDKIITLLSLYEVYLHNKNKTHRTDFNIECEGIFCDVLNKMYNWNLVNLNSTRHNYPAVDLGDEKNGVYVQVTSESTSSKINETIKNFNENDLKSIYARIYVLILGKKKKYQSIDSGMIIDFSDIISYLSFSNDRDYLLDILELLNNKFIQYNIPGAPPTFFTTPEAILKPAKNYKSYKQYLINLKFNEEEINSVINDIIFFASELLKLHINTRKLILFGIKYRIYHAEWYHDWKNYIHFNYKSMLLHIDKVILDYSINELITLNHISGFNDEECVCHFYFPDEGNNYCVLNDVCEFCNKTKKNIEQLLINFDFTIFD